jgi:hypothetical protein
MPNDPDSPFVLKKEKRIMNAARKPPAKPTVRRDGWTPARRRRFIDALAAGSDVRRACAAAGLSRQAAYKLRQRDPAFAQDWQSALRTAHEADVEAFLSALPENLLRTLSDLSGLCQLRAASAGPPA